MFGKRECKNCERKVNKKYEFCPYCGSSQDEKSRKKEDYGMLGEGDEMNNINNISKELFKGFSGKMLNKLIGSALKVFENEMQKEIEKEKKETSKNKNNANFQLFINGKKVNLGKNYEIEEEPIQERIREDSLKRFSSKNIKKFSELPKKEPETNIRRISNKIIYEVDIPGVKSTDEVSIDKFENSIEIRAIAKDKAYVKIIPINLPITNYNLSNGKLTLELFGE